MIEDDKKFEITIPSKKKRNTRKKSYIQDECKLLGEETCLSRTDCLFNKSQKCQKKPTMLNKTMKHIETTNEIIDHDIVLNEEQLIVHDIENLKNNSEKQYLDNVEIKQSLITEEKKSACDEIQMLREELNKIRKQYDTKIKECEEELFSDFIHNYFNQIEYKLTHYDLLVGLQKYYIDEKTKDVNFILSMQEFIQKFSQKMPIKGTNYKRQHIFEALCRLLVYLNYDKGELGTNKQFYNSLEGFINGSTDTINNNILTTKINEGSRAGIVDIFFKSKKNTKDDNLWACENIYNKETDTVSEEPNEYIMIQNKYYDVEKSNISNYDVTRIYTLASLTNKKNTKFDGPIKIILMVNNEDAVSHNLSKAKQQYTDLFDKKNGIIGVVSLNNWFQQLLFDLFKSKNISEFEKLNKSSIKKKESIQLRFHQRYITNCSTELIKNGISSFIWGAVPRSGKSYMIGGLVSERYNTGMFNNIVIILGALTETLQQFKDMFEKFSDFDKYTVITPDSTSKEGDLNIYLLSQEWLKDKVRVNVNEINKKIEPDTASFNEKMMHKYPRLFSNGKIDLYFDEVHKGGSTDISESIIYAFKNTDIKIDIFVMVTATFAKPTLRYNKLNFIGSGSQDTEIIEWSYDDQQNMKNMTDETKKHMMVNSRQNKQRKILMDTFDFYQEYYGADYLNALSNEYKKHPELVLISPHSIDIKSTTDTIVPTTEDIRNVFLNNLKCDACTPDKEITFYQNPANIFNKPVPVDNLLNYIIVHIHNYFKAELKYNIDSVHTELWFLPDKHLYGTNSECKDICRPIVENEKNMDENDTKTKGVPNIEPLTRGLAIKICQNVAFNKYNVLIVHNTKFNYLGSKIKSTDIFGDFKSDTGKTRINMFSFENKKDISLAKQIKEFENDSYKNGQSLIILTGAKLRLGISLPCADIAFNFDDIKSIDNNYQTMFRVLTEREKPELKKYGYYLDFNKDRAIQFIYEYNKIYGEAKKLQSKEALESLQSLLFTFNYNGLNLIKNDTKTELNLYGRLIGDLELNEEGYIKFWSQKTNIVNLIKKSFSSSGNLDILKELSKILRADKIKQSKKNEKHILDEGNLRQQMPVIVKPNDEEEHSDEEEDANDEGEKEEDTKDDVGELINNIAESLPSIIVLLAMFSNEPNNECSDIKECLHLSLRNIVHLEKQCSCENIEDSNILDCFFNSPGLINGVWAYDKNKLEKIVRLIIDLIDTEDNTLHSNLNFIFGNIKTLMTKSNGIIHDMNGIDIEEKIEQYLSVREEEKNKYGEVFTPIKLIEEMFDNLPESVWMNHEFKWLDPANGIGNFPMVAYQKLMKGLEKWEPNQNKRSKHIIENMLYMVEINPKNVKISKKIFGTNANICCADFLKDTEKCFKTFGVDKFNVIIGNPPFNDKNNEENKTNKALWPKFIEKSLEILDANGFLGFINPQNWRGPDSKLWGLLSNKQFIYLHIYGEKAGRDFFNVGTKVDLYVLQNKKNTKETTVIDETGVSHKLNLSDFSLLPNYKILEINKIISKDRGIDIIQNTFYSTSQTSETKQKYVVISSITDGNKLHFRYTKDNTKGHFGVPKVIINGGRYPYPYNDYQGEYGMTQNVFGIPISSKKQGDDIVKAINTDEFNEIIKAAKWGTFGIDYRFFKKIKPDFYKYFLKDKHDNKSQSLEGGRQKRKRTKKIDSATKGGNKQTRKHKSLFKFW